MCVSGLGPLEHSEYYTILWFIRNGKDLNAELLSRTFSQIYSLYWFSISLYWFSISLYWFRIIQVQ